MRRTTSAPTRRRGSVSKPKSETENIAVVVRVNGKPLEKGEKSVLQYDNEKTVLDTVRSGFGGIGTC